MKRLILTFSCAVILGAITTSVADQLEMRNGDRYTGKILSASPDAVVLQNEVLGTIQLPRKNVASLTMGSNTPPKTITKAPEWAAVSTNLPKITSLNASAAGNTNTPATPQAMAANMELVRKVREQLLGGSPEAAAKYDELVNSFISGRTTLSEIQRQAKVSVNQLEQIKRELGPEAGDVLDGYLEILNGFLQKANDGSPTASPDP